MPAPSCRIAQAAQFLANSSATTKEKLIIGGNLLWAATTLSKDWPSGLVEKSKKAQYALFRGGNVKRTVEEMSEKTAAECLKQLSKDVA